MGAMEFIVRASGTTAEEAFQEAVEVACNAYGRNGDTGSIAEKDSIVLIPLPEGKEAEKYAKELLRNDDPRIDNKWGPAGCILVKSSTKNVETIKSLPVTKVDVKEYKFEGAREWKTFYVIRKVSGQELAKTEKKAEAVKLAKELALKHKERVILTLEKRLENSAPLLAEFTPEVKQVKAIKTIPDNEYIFFGYASC